MSNERLRLAINQAGLDPDALAELIEVDVKSVHRWLAGRAAYPRHRAKVAKVLAVEEHELWPELLTAPTEDRESRGEFQGAWAHASDDGVPDWQELLHNAVDRIQLLDYSLLDVVSVDGVTDTLATKADEGVRVLILVSAPDSIWVAARARELGQEDDYVGRSPLQLETEMARAYLAPLAAHPGIELREFCTASAHKILRFDDQLLLISLPRGIPSSDAPLLHLRRTGEGGLFGRWSAHIEAIADEASKPIRLAPDSYPSPATHPDRYQPLTRAAYEQQLEAGRQRYHSQAATPRRPLEEVRTEIRRTGPPAEPTAAD